MTWAWEWDGWPQYSMSESDRRTDFESKFLKDARLASETLGRMDAAARGGIEAKLLATEAVMTSKIENVALDPDAVLRSFRHLMGLDTDSSATGSYEMSVARFTLDVHLNFAEPLTAERLFSWHERLMEGHPRVRDVGRYRRESVMVAASSPGNYKVLYVAPPPARVPDDMKRFLDWFDAIPQQQGDALSILKNAALAHLHFVQIHPFEDGNGRIARAIADTAMARGLGMSTPVKLSHDIFVSRNGYYEELAQTNIDIKVTDWLMYFTQTGTESAERTLRRIEEACG